MVESRALYMPMPPPLALLMASVLASKKVSIKAAVSCVAVEDFLNTMDLLHLSDSN